MKRRDLISRIAKTAKANKVSWDLVREGANHEIWQCGSTKVSIPRHREVNESTATGIMKDLETELGEGWWK